MSVVDGTRCEGRFACSRVFIGSLRWGGIVSAGVSAGVSGVVLRRGRHSLVARSAANGVNLSPRSLAVALLPHAASNLRRMGRDGRGVVVFRLGVNDGCVFGRLGGILPGLYAWTVLGLRLCRHCAAEARLTVNFDKPVSSRLQAVQSSGKSMHRG